MVESYTVRHVEYVSSRTFDEVVQEFETITGAIEDGRFASELSASADRADFEDRMHGYESDLGFMRFLMLDHGQWLKLYGIDARCRLYTLGNPLIAQTMLKHDIAVGLNVPVRLVIYEKQGKVYLEYDLPSSLMGRLKNEELSVAAGRLDAKLEQLARRATGLLH
jgi:uncharacterized protein (DUF302 family)